MADQHSDNAPKDTAGSGRRSGERRQQQGPVDGPDHRKGDRRTGGDRRSAPRREGTLDSED